MKRFVMNDNGRFRIEIDGKVSRSVGHGGIATLEIDGKLFAGVSACYAGTLPHETVFEVVKQDGVQNIIENFTEPDVPIKER